MNAALPMGGEEHLGRLWHEYKQARADAIRDYLLVHYAPLVKFVAGRLAIGLPPNVDMDDLIGYGIFGLLDAIEKFDPERGFKFETYATGRIRGAILDGLRATDWVPRSVRQKGRELDHAVGKLEAQLGRPATDAEICAALGMTVHEYHQLLSDLRAATLVSLDEILVGQDGEEETRTRMLETVEDHLAPDPERQAGEADVRRVLAAAIDALPERERLVITLYYYERLTLKEIGAVLDVTESRVSQIHSKAMMRLRGRLAHMKESLVG